MYRQTTIWESLESTSNTSHELQPTTEVLSMPDAEVILYHHLFNQKESDKLFFELLNHTHWRQDSIKMYGKSIPLPRLTAWYGDTGKSYTYSGITMNPEPWNSTLIKIKSKIEPLSGVKFNGVLMNLYRSGKDSMSWHSDDEPELGRNPVIGSVTFGDTRRFMFRRKDKQDRRRIDIDLTHGSFLIMRGATQHFWQHQIPKTSKPVKPRINLTFRVII